MKRFLSAILASTLVFSTAVSPKAAAPAATSTPAMDKAVKSVVDDKKKVSISFWTGTGAANFPLLEEMVKNFQTKYPNITVDFSNQGPVTELTAKLTQNIVSKSTPTMSNINSTTFLEYVKSKAIVDLAPYYNNGKIGFTQQEKDDFMKSYISESQSYSTNGTMYGFPTNKKTTDVLTYNKTYFDKKGWTAPKTWDDVVKYSKAIKEETGKPGFSFDNSYGDAAFKLMSRQWGSAYIKDDGTIDINNDATREALKFYKTNMTAGYFTMPALMPSAGGKNSSNGFVKEECYMFVGAAAGIAFAMPKADGDKAPFELGIAPVPQRVTANPIAYSKGEDYCIFSNASDEERVAAWLLIKFLSEPEQNTKWFVNTGNLPINNKMLDVAEYKSFLNADKKDLKTFYVAGAVKAALEMKDYMTFDRIIEKSSKLATETGALWESIMIGNADINSSLEATANKLK